MAEIDSEYSVEKGYQEVSDIYRYYVAYLFKANGNFGHGCAEVSRLRPVESFEDVQIIAADLGKEANAEGLTIVNWICLQ